MPLRPVTDGAEFAKYILTMKRILSLLIGISVLTACLAQKVQLELNLTKGETYTQLMTTTVTTLQTVNGQDITMKMSATGKMTYKVTDIRDAVYDMEVNYERLTMKMSLPNGDMEFSSEKTDKTDVFSGLLGAMLNKPFSIEMSKTGKVNKVKNIDAVFSAMFDNYPHLSDAEKKALEGMLMQTYGEKALKGNIELCSAIFADSPVAKADKWTVTTQLESGMPATVESVYELKEISDSYYQLVGTSTIETADKDAYVETNGMPVRYDMAGTMTSDITIDSKSRWITHALITQSIKGMAHVKGSPQQPEGMSMSMVTNTQMVITDK